MSGERHLDTWQRRDLAEKRVEELERENAELREEAQRLKTLNTDLTKARDRAVARLREEERNRAWERTRAEELVMAKTHELGKLREALKG